MIEVTNLSSDVDLESFRVSGLGSARLLVTTCSLDQYPDIPTSDPIRDLQSRLRELTNEKDALEAKITILKGFGENMANMPDLTPDSATSFSDALFEETLSNATAIRELDAQITELGRQINKLRNAKVGTANARAVVTIVADGAGPAQLRLTYRVSDARWLPLYDLRAYSQDGKPSTSVSLHYRVNLSQSTGEDWNEAKLILSTSQTDILNAGIPTSDGLVIEPIPKPPPSPASSAEVVRSRYATMAARAMVVQPEAVSSVGSEEYEDDESAESFGGAASFPAVVLPEMSEGGAAISKSPMAVNYTVDDLTTIPSDDVSHKVLVAVIPLEASISHITTPRKSPLAYLQCSVKNTSEYSLLPGTLSVFLDDSFVSKTEVPNVGTGDTFRCTLGMDTSIQVSNALTETSETSAPSSFVEQYTTTTYVSTTTLRNRHTGDYPVNIVERSSIPVASIDDPRIKVFLKGPKELATAEDGVEVDLGRSDGFKVKWGRDLEETRNGKKEGKFIWYGTISPGEEIVLVSEWDVKAPVDTKWRIKS
ncbi:hypothetical protein BDM02DRAFT_1911688 [Thelephora ganbajun]|uniref:Uncharacterized protein n=1 Tax=Thelephora ganbajun TaxID=370292 RepID=A0ACB6ZVE1_THEGA|nr:hypothetical protein BDM02DRAFT_1911688 [Thelephora ganbajun]